MMPQPSSPSFTLRLRSVGVHELEPHESSVGDVGIGTSDAPTSTKKLSLRFVEDSQGHSRNRSQPRRTLPPESRLTRYSIGALSAATGATVKTLRFWTEQGLLEASRSDANYRSYGVGAPARVAFIRSAQAMGFRLRDIKALLSLADGEVKPCDEVKALTRTRLAEVQTQLQQLQVFAEALRALAALPDEACPDEGCLFLPRH